MIIIKGRKSYECNCFKHIIQQFQSSRQSTTHISKNNGWNKFSTGRMTVKMWRQQKKKKKFDHFWGLHCNLLAERFNNRPLSIVCWLYAYRNSVRKEGSGDRINVIILSEVTSLWNGLLLDVVSSSSIALTIIVRLSGEKLFNWLSNRQFRF